MVKKDEIIGTLSFWGPYFRVYTEFRIRSIVSKWTDILNFNIAENSVGSKGAPRLSVKGNKLYIQTFIGETNKIMSYMIEENKWYKVEILQDFTSQGVSLNTLTRPVDCTLTAQDHFTLRIDNRTVHKLVNSEARPYYEVRVFAGQGYIPVETELRCLSWETLAGPESCEWDRRWVVGGTGNHLDSLLEEGSEFLEGTNSTSWFGENEQIVVDLGCKKTINGFYMRNFHSGSDWTDGTKEFEISFCNNSTFSECSNSKTFSMSQVTGASQEKTVFFPLEAEVTARFVRIKIISFFGSRGGLHYFKENESPTKGFTYQGSK